MNNTMFDAAVREFLKVATITEHAVEGVNSYSSYYNAGVIYESMGNAAEALKCYKKC